MPSKKNRKSKAKPKARSGTQVGDVLAQARNEARVAASEVDSINSLPVHTDDTTSTVSNLNNNFLFYPESLNNPANHNKSPLNTRPAWNPSGGRSLRSGIISAPGRSLSPLGGPGPSPSS